jgi:TonB family protein
MNEFMTAFLLAAILGASTQDTTLEDKAVNRVQQTPASQYDPTLPSRPFGNWLNQVVGPQSGVSWRLGECVDQNGTASGWEQDIPACVEATAILPDDRKIVTQIHVGSFKQGLSITTKFHFAVIEKDSQFLSLRKLSDLPQLLRDPLSAKKSDERKKPKGVTLPQVKMNGAPQLYYAEAPALFSPPETALDETENEPPPPPKPTAAPKISKLIAGYALTKAPPIYPPMAMQMKASGAVQVAIIISENGRVIEAKAVSGHPALRSAAEEAARKWVFRPASLDGKPMRQQDVLSFTFTPPQ